MTPAADRQAIRALVLDIDGVLTDGTIGRDKGGDRRIHLRDLDALVRARRSGLQIAFLTGEGADGVSWIVERCGGGPVRYGAKDKVRGLERLAEDLGVDVSCMCYMADARRDVDALKLCGLGLAPRDADPLALAAASRILKSSGGKGAVAEAVDLLLDGGGPS